MKSKRARRCALVLAVMATAAANARAEDSAAAREGCASECGSWWSYTLGGGYGNHLGAYASGGILLGDVRYLGPLVAAGDGVLFQGQVGRNGWTASAAVPVPWLKLPITLNYRGDRKRFSFPVAGLSMRATLLRTWRGTADLPSRHTYFGPEIEAAFGLHLRVGCLFRIRGEDGPKRILTVSVGLGI